MAKEASILTQPLDDRPGVVESFLQRFGNVALLFEQADSSLTVGKFCAHFGRTRRSVATRGRSAAASIPRFCR